MKTIFLIILVLGNIVSCSTPKQEEQNKTTLDIDYDLVTSLPKQTISYQQSIKPILGSRCVVCHGCYDAPCQLKLSSIEGIKRGASKTPVYNSARFAPDPPSRLFIDANSSQQWRKKGFFPVLNEPIANSKQDNNTALDNLKNSLMYHLINLKQVHPQPRVGKLSPDIKLELDDKPECATLGEFNNFANNHPDWGMPYGLPNLSDNEYKLLGHWIAQGSPVENNKKLDQQTIQDISTWETFLNNNNKDLKNRLVSRYIYEHIYLSHIHFTEQQIKQTIKSQTPLFFRLVRSSTPPGQEIKEIKSNRPYDSPGKSVFYYRFKQDFSQTVIKNHKVYSLSDKKLQRFKQLFFEADYQVTQWPGYEAEIASNPFKVFKEIPPVSRYKFLLDDAHFFIEGFIKGPVCRGQISLNVIDDYFWVTFINPEINIETLNSEFLDQNLDFFQLPADKEKDLKVFNIWTHYWQNQKKYIHSKIEMFKNMPSLPLNEAMKYIYNGQEKNSNEINPNAALTIFRHFDSASVSYGLVANGINGKGPETTLVVDYPILERIHYLLVAGFDVYGNIGHQLKTRVYMDFLRMEGEDNFLAFLPVSARKKIRNSWYKGIRKDVAKYFKAPTDWLSVQSVTGYQSKQPKLELYQTLQHHLRSTQTLALEKNRGVQEKHGQKQNVLTAEEELKINRFMEQVNSLSGEKLEIIPDVTFLRIKMKNTKQHRALTIINNKAYKHLHSLFEDDKTNTQRDYHFDSLIIVDWLEGSYPNFFLDVNYDDLEQFSHQFQAIANQQDYEKFIALYGIRRTNNEFRELSDWFYQYYKKSHPIQAGYFDLNRYQNR